jgi:cytochrome c6
MLARALLGIALLTRPSLAAGPSPESLFVFNCSACHQRNGQGIPQAFPALAGDALVQGDPHDLVALLLNGRGGMPAFKSQLDDAQIAAVASYVRGSWGNHADPVPEVLVTETRHDDAMPEAEHSLQAH